MKTMSKAERSLLLYFESRSVDNAGRCKSESLNDADRAIAEKWNKENFVSFGRVASEDLNASAGNLWSYLSERAWELAAAERRARAGRMWGKRNWKSTDEKRALAVMAKSKI